MSAPVTEFIQKYQSVLARATKLHGTPEPLGFTLRPALKPGHFTRLEGCFRSPRDIRIADRTEKHLKTVRESIRNTTHPEQIRTGKTLRTHRCSGLTCLFRDY